MFASDLARGIESELKVLRELQTRYPDAFKVEGKHSEYDLEVPGKFTVEVKFDPASQRTGNIVVEYYHRVVSGLHVSTADLVGVRYWREVYLAHQVRRTSVYFQRAVPPGKNSRSGRSLSEVGVSNSRSRS